MRRAARTASARVAKGEAAANAAAKRRLPFTRSTSSTASDLAIVDGGLLDCAKLSKEARDPDGTVQDFGLVGIDRVVDDDPGEKKSGSLQ
jgi:hypothetical protein